MWGSIATSLSRPATAPFFRRCAATMSQRAAGAASRNAALRRLSQGAFQPQHGSFVRHMSSESTPPPPKPEPSKKSVKSLNDAAGRFSTLAYRSLGLMVLTGAAVYVYFDLEKEKAKLAQKEREANQSVGKAKIGGPFSLIGEDGKAVTEKNFLGKFMLIYFGFTNCPDVCPEELDKMAEVLDTMDSAESHKVAPVFVSVDPKRDSIAAVAEYVREFHPRLVGLTGDYASVKAAARTYRVYFSSPPPEEVTDDDYLVDHSIFVYLMDPAGEFVDAYGKNVTAQQFRERLLGRIKEWEQKNGPIKSE